MEIDVWSWGIAATSSGRLVAADTAREASVVVDGDRMRTPARLAGGRESSHKTQYREHDMSEREREREGRLTGCRPSLLFHELRLRRRRIQICGHVSTASTQQFILDLAKLIRNRTTRLFTPTGATIYVYRSLLLSLLFCLFGTNIYSSNNEGWTWLLFRC